MEENTNQQALENSPTQVNKPFYLRISLMFCSFLAYSCSCVQYGMKAVFLLKIPLYILKSPAPLFKTLYGIWYARIVRRMLSVFVRTPLRKRTLQLVNFTIPVPCDSGCVIAICHTPWKRILVQWCLENNFALIISGGTWTHQKKLIQRQGAGISELRGIVKYLQLNGRIILAADNFNNLNNCPVKFLGNNYNASIAHVRFAIIAKVPLMVVTPKLCNTSIDFTIGPQFEYSNLRLDIHKTTQDILSFLEKEIEHYPSIWSTYVN